MTLPYQDVSPSRILVRATNWIGDAVMSIPALEAIRKRFPDAHIAILARPWVTDVYQGAAFCNEIIPHPPGRLDAVRLLQAGRFGAALLLPNSFDSALICWLARIPIRIGYARDGRSLLLTHPVPVPKPGEIPTHERYYYLELLRRAGWLDKLPEDGAPIHLPVTPRPFDDLGPVIGLSPGAALARPSAGSQNASRNPPCNWRISGTPRL